MVYYREKIVDRDAICPINVIFRTKKPRPTCVDPVDPIFNTPRLQTSDFERSAQYCHYKSDN